MFAPLLPALRVLTTARLSVLLLLTALCQRPAHAQVIFHASNLPSQTNQYCRAYYSTNVNVAALLGQTNGPQRWDLSQPQQPNETIRRTDIVTPSDGGNGASFPDAAYAERDTDESTATRIAWRYYSLTNTGRLYYGFYNPVDFSVTPLVVFDHPTLDVPASVEFGQTWDRSVAWTNMVLVIYPIAYHFTASAQVDAYGTLALPEIGEVAALRVRELHDYETSEYISIIDDWVPLTSQTNVFYYWLAPRVGIAAQIVLFGNNTLYPIPLPHTNVVLRVFEASGVTNQPPFSPAADLRIHVQGGLARLDWRQATNASAYQVTSSGNLTRTNWQWVAMPATNSWSEAVTATQRFYRVFVIP